MRVNKREFDLAALDKLPQITINETVGYRLGWSSGKVKLHGVRLRDVLKFVGEKLPQQGKVMVRGKARFYDDAANLVRLSYSEVRDCDVILATRWGFQKVRQIRMRLVLKKANTQRVRARHCRAPTKKAHPYLSSFSAGEVALPDRV